MTLEFSFWTSFRTKVKKPNLPYILPVAGERIIGFIPQKYSRYVRFKQPRPEFEVESLYTFSTTIIIALQVSLNAVII